MKAFTPIKKSFLLISLLLIFPLRAVETQKVSDEKYVDFAGGKAEGVTLTSEGTIILSPALKKITDITSAYLWDAAFDQQGNLFISTGDKAKVWKVSTNGETKEFFTSDDTNIFALAINNKGEVFIATSPDGKVLRLDKDGKSSVYFEPKEKNVFAMIFDQDDNLYVATGDKGIIYKVTGENQSSVFFDSDEPNIVSLAWDNDKNLLAGTQGTGLLYRIHPGDKSSYVLLSSNQKEVKRIGVTPDGGIFALVLDGTGANTPTTHKSPDLNTVANIMNLQNTAAPATPAPQPIPAPLDSTTAPGQVENGEPGKGGSTVLHYLAPDGQFQKVWSSKFTGHSLIIRDSKALVGTGDDGYLFEIDSQGKANLVQKLPSNQITKLAGKDDGTVYLIGSNTGGVWSLLKEKSAEGIFESEVFNSNFFVRWGNLQVEAATPDGSEITIYSRSGNTPTSDKSWSEWKPVSDGKIQSPASQYFQYKLVLKGKTSPIINIVSFFYRPANLPPVISNIEILASSYFPFPIQVNAPGMTPAMIAAQISAMQMAINTPPPSPTDIGAQNAMMQMPKSLGAPTRGLHFALWNAADPNQDNLLYKVSYKMEGDNSWHHLEEQLDAPIFMWDTTGWPDGNYFIKVDADDSLSNLPGEIQSTDDTSRRFQIDNTPPVMTNVKISGKQAQFTVTDNLSTIKSVTASTDGLHYFPVAPTQGILDNKEKSFIYTAPDLVDRVFIRMEDADSNIGAGKIDFK